MKESLRILFQDDCLVAVHKPPGLLVHRSWISTDRVFLLQMLRDQLGRRVYPAHRLDRATSGVMMFGLSSDVAARLGAMFTDRRVKKIYHAVVRGWMPEADFVVDHPVRDMESDKPLQEAQTRFRELARVELPVAVDRYPTARYSLVQAVPRTGRRHQIRKHFKHISHPIIGDTSYGKGVHNRFFRDRFGVERLLLLAQKLEFEHPCTGQTISISAGLEQQWSELMHSLGWDL